MVLVLGTPGSGCTTFLKAIANQRAEYASIDGDVKYAGIDAGEMAKYYNRRRGPVPEIKAGDRVWLDSSDIATTRPSKKLSDRWLGPYKVEKVISPMAYRLKLPPSMSRLHPVFPIVKLRLHISDPITGRHPKPPPPLPPPPPPWPWLLPHLPPPPF